MTDAKVLIENLNMVPHPEGGFYRETYRCPETMLAGWNNKPRNLSTSIYFLLEDDNISHFHRIKSDEHWFFHEGASIEIFILEKDKLISVVLGKNLDAGETFYAVVPAGSWFASRVKGANGYGLVSCMVAPGFDFEDFELGRKSELLKSFPQYSDLINAMALD